MAADRNELKVRALLERVRDITTQYENERADLRVEITILAERNAELEQLVAAQAEEEPVDGPLLEASADDSSD